MIHAADFGDREGYRDCSVLVIGAGNSGVDALNHLVRVRTRALWVAVRTGVDLSRLAEEGVAPAIDDGFVDALKSGRVSIVPAVTRFDGGKVVLRDQRQLTPDMVIAATGYSPGLDSMVGHLGALDDRGIPRFHAGDADARRPGLWFLGMKPRIFGTFHAARRDSRRLARQIARLDVRLRKGLPRAGDQAPR